MAPLLLRRRRAAPAVVGQRGCGRRLRLFVCAAVAVVTEIAAAFTGVVSTLIRVASVHAAAARSGCVRVLRGSRRAANHVVRAAVRVLAPLIALAMITVLYTRASVRTLIAVEATSA
jgi:hypothetical protein